MNRKSTADLPFAQLVPGLSPSKSVVCWAWHWPLRPGWCCENHWAKSSTSCMRKWGGFGQPAQVRPRALLHRPGPEDHGVGNPDVWRASHTAVALWNVAVGSVSLEKVQ